MCLPIVLSTAEASELVSMVSLEQGFVIPPTPTCVEEFNKEWIKYVMDDWFAKNDIKTESVDIVNFAASLNSLQVI